MGLRLLRFMNMKDKFMKRALFPGSFDPITNGHIDIIKRAADLFDEVTVGIAQNSHKTGLFNLAERQAMIEALFENDERIKVAVISGLTADYVKANAIDVIVRGLRNTQDFDYEQPIALMNEHLVNVETILLLAKPENIMVSSSMLKEVAHAGGDIRDFVPDNVYELICQKFEGA